MADGPSGAGKAEAYWAKIMLSARVHATTAEMWSMIRSEAATIGYTGKLPSLQDVNRLRSTATGLRTASERLMGSQRSDAITSRMLAPTMYARSPGQMESAPSWHVRYELETIRDGEAVTSWYVMGYQGAFPATVGELYDDLEAYSAGLGDDYGVGVGGIGTVSIEVY